MQRLVACAPIIALTAAIACSSARHGFERKLVIIAFDGMDLHLVTRLTREGKLPAIAGLAARNSLRPLETTPAPQHAPARASFASGMNAGKHGVFDLLLRDPATYQPRIAITRASGSLALESTAFWALAARAGVRYSSTGVPAAEDERLRLEETPIEESALLKRVSAAFNDQAQQFLAALDSENWDLLVGTFDGLDVVQHLTWRYLDRAHPMFDERLAEQYGAAIEQIYQRADALVGRVLERVDEDTTLVVTSAHGFGPARWSVSLNSWLVERGYMYLHGPSQRNDTSADLRRGGFLSNVDWPQTRVYSVGFGQLYVNLKGREGRGIVAAGEEREQLLDSLIIDLMSFLDPRTQSRVVASVYKATEIYSGPFLERAPDLLVGLERGYHVPLPSALGATPAHVIAPNMRQWSGEHSASDYRAVPGVLLSTRPVSAHLARLIDIAPTVLKYFGVAIPAEMDGHPLF